MHQWGHICKYRRGFNKSKLTAESKQTADIIKSNIFSYLANLHCISEVISEGIAKIINK